MTDYHNIEMQSASTLEMTTAHGASSFDQPGGLGMAEEDELFSQEAAISSTALARPFRLRQITVMCMIFNRMIGKFMASLGGQATSNCTAFRNWHISNPCNSFQLHRECWHKYAMVVFRSCCRDVWYSCLHGTGTHPPIIQDRWQDSLSTPQWG
jgi:hypothetical protein